MEPEPRAAGLADARVQVLHALEMAGPAGLRREHPAPGSLGKAVPPGHAPFEDGRELTGDGKLQRRAGPGVLDSEGLRRHVDARPGEAEHLAPAHAGVEAEAEGVARDRVV